MEIGVEVYGFVVGRVAIEILKNYHKVVGYDKFKKEFKNNFSKLDKCEVIFIAVPTLMQDSWKINLSILHKVLSELEGANFFKNQ